MKKYICAYCNKISTKEEINTISYKAAVVSPFYMCPKCQRVLMNESLIEVEEEKELRTYKTWEVIKMLTENPKLKFKPYKKYLGENSSISIKGERICWNDNYTTPLFILTGKEMMEWTLVQQPVTFEEVLNSKKAVRVEHDFIDIAKNVIKIPSYEPINKLIIKNFYDEKHMNFCDLILVLGYMLNSLELKEVIKNGKWFLKED